jgi:hypothetical protein
MTATPDARRVGARVEQLLDGLAASDDPRARAQAEELVRQLVDLYGAGLARIVDIVLTEADDSTRLAEQFAADELVASLLVLHGLHPHDIEDRVRAAIAGLGAKADGVRLVGVDSDGVAHLRLQLTGCGSSADGLRRDIEGAITGAVGDVTSVRIEELPKVKADATLIPTDALFRDRPAAAVRR